MCIFGDVDPVFKVEEGVCVCVRACVRAREYICTKTYICILYIYIYIYIYICDLKIYLQKNLLLVWC